MRLEPLEFSYLQACAEMVRRQQEVLPLLAARLGTVPEELLYRWKEADFPAIPEDADGLGRQTGPIGTTGWTFFFHGLECDLSHEDGRFIRADFGPRGRVDTFTGWGVLQFVMTSRPPWREFPELREHLADNPPPYDSLSGSHARMCVLEDRMEALGLIQPSAPDLCALVEAGRTKSKEGYNLITLPDELTLRDHIDCMVCYRSVLSTSALALLARSRTRTAD
jgi:hypothetical protein